LDKDTANPFNLKHEEEKELLSITIPEDIAPAEEKEKWYLKETEAAPKEIKE